MSEAMQELETNKEACHAQISLDDNAPSDIDETPASSPAQEMQSEPSLSEKHPALSKYRDLQKIGAGAQGTMLRGLDEDGQWIAIKVFDIQTTDSLKSIELFEREIETIKNLHIKGVPKYIDTIKDNRYIYLIEEYIQAKSLENRLKEGERYAFDQILKILIHAALILKDLEDLVPPVIHRDIKPGNILIDDEENVYLVDFGVVADKVQASFAMTFAGTVGYVAPEQLYGKVTPAADIFSLGMTILNLVTNVSPCDMMNENMELRVDRYMPPNIPTWFVRLLKQMVEPNVSQRLKTGKQILDYIESHRNKEDLQDSSIEIESRNATTVKNNNKPEDKYRNELKNVYMTCHDFFDDYKTSFWIAPLLALITTFPIFYIVCHLILHYPYSVYLTDWMPFLIPFTLFFIAIVGNSPISNSDYKHRRAKIIKNSIELNKLYKDEIVYPQRPSKDEFINSPTFIELSQKVKTPENFPLDDVTPLDEEENACLDKYLKDEDVLYPCIEYKIEYKLNKLEFTQMIISYLALFVITIVLIPYIAQMSGWWYLIYFIICDLCFLKILLNILNFFRFQKKRLQDPINQYAYELYYRRFISECRMYWDKSR